jgi:hypothetical protein
MEAHQEEEVDPLAAMPPVPPKTTFEPVAGPAYDASSRLPNIDKDKVAAMTAVSDRERLEGDLKSGGALRHTTPPIPSAVNASSSARSLSCFVIASVWYVESLKAEISRLSNLEM